MNCLLPRNMSLLEHNDLSTIQKRYWCLNQHIKFPPGSELQRELEDSSQDVMTDKYRVMK